MGTKKEENKNIDDVKVTIGGREIKGITSMKYEDSNKIINYKKANKMKKTIYNLELNETIFIEQTQKGVFIESTSVTRVPGGWIYINFAQIKGEKEVSITSNSVFVPYNEEFKKS